MRDVWYGWITRYAHANGASFFFILVYLHMFRGLFYTSYLYPRRLLWISGVAIFLLLILTSFLGYVLPWGQMSFWAATVITNLASTVPFFGTVIVNWLWSDYSVSNATLNKFYSLHFIFPFIIALLVVTHLIFLHLHKSNMPLGIAFHVDALPINPYYTLKDLYSFLVLLSLFAIVIAFMPNLMGHPDNYIPANPSITPEHIVPEWYFLPFYAILRSIPDKLFGVIALAFSIILLFILPFVHTPIKRLTQFNPFVYLLHMFFAANYILLGFIGQSPLEEPFLSLGQYATFIYLLYFIILALSDLWKYTPRAKIKAKKARLKERTLFALKANRKY
jgi:quinol-cytochrome oxidoreductase complex cytochrome b subunit